MAEFLVSGKKKKDSRNPEPLMASEIPSAPVDFDPANEAMCREGSTFYDKMIVQKITPYGPVSIDGNQFTFRQMKGCI